MINKIAQYKAAVGKRSVGSDPSPSTMSKAGDTAIGRKSSSSVTNKPIAHKGSWEGYMHAPRADISMSNTGYLAHAAQKARNNVRQNMDFSLPPRQSIDSNYRARSKPFDYTYCGSPGNSTHLLKQHMELNDLFKG